MPADGAAADRAESVAEQVEALARETNGEAAPSGHRAGVPLAGTLLLDVGALQRSVDAFFARLANLGEAGSDPRLPAEVASWLMVVAAVALEFARLRQEQSGRRPLPWLDGVPGLAAFPPGDES
jgi:hypothetical protein